ncbi:MAG: hypothetical protein ACFB0G_20325 [Leptolyngbyaceae cyanobacterium]
MTDASINKFIARNVEVSTSQDAEPGKSASGQPLGVQLAQDPFVNDPQAIVPSGVDVDKNRQQVEAVIQQERGTLPTTRGYEIDESGNLDNFALEPPMYVEE